MKDFSPVRNWERRDFLVHLYVAKVFHSNTMWQVDRKLMFDWQQVRAVNINKRRSNNIKYKERTNAINEWLLLSLTIISVCLCVYRCNRGLNLNGDLKKMQHCEVRLGDEEKLIRVIWETSMKGCIFQELICKRKVSWTD